MNEITDKEYFFGLLATIIFLSFYIRWQTKKYKKSDDPMDTAKKLKSYIILIFVILLFIFFTMKLIGNS